MMVRNAVAADFDFIYELYMHPAVNPYLLYETMDKASFQPIYDDLIARKVKYIQMDENGESIGMFKLVPLTYRNSHIVYLGGLAIDPGQSGRGYGSSMILNIIKLAAQRGFKRIDLSVSVENKKAISLYEKAGFQHEGILKHYTYLEKENRYLDESLMSYLF